MGGIYRSLSHRISALDDVLAEPNDRIEAPWLQRFQSLSTFSASGPTTRPPWSWLPATPLSTFSLKRLGSSVRCVTHPKRIGQIKRQGQGP